MVTRSEMMIELRLGLMIELRLGLMIELRVRVFTRSPVGFARSRRLIRSGRELLRSPSLRGCIYLFFKKTINIFTPFFLFFLKLKMKLLCSHTSIIQL